MASYSFPILPNAEILACLQELELPLSEQDLLKPSYEVVKPVYDGFLHLLMGMTREELQQPVFSAINELEYPEMHDESIGHLAFDRAVSRLMQASGVSDFTFQDIAKPDHKRLRRNLSAVINFAKFREEKLSAYQQLQEQSEATLDRKTQLEEANMQLKSELAKIQQQRAADEPTVARMQTEVDEITAKLNALNHQQAVLKSEVTSFKSTSIQLTQKVGDVKEKLSKAREENARFQSQIVQSPQKLQRLLEELAQAVEDERTAIANAEQRSRELLGKVESTQKVEEKVRKCIQMLEELEAEVTKRKAVSRNVKAAKAQLEAQHKKTLDLQLSQQHLSRQAQNAEERLRRFEEHASVKRDKAATAVHTARDSRTTVERERAHAAAQAEAMEAKVAEMQSKIAEARNAHSQESAALLAQFDRLRAQVKRYNSKLFEAMKERMPLAVVNGRS
eukprot:jgi/Chlat1/7717/Chrsp66S07191